MLTFDIREAPTGSLPTAGNDASRGFATTDSFPNLSEDLPGDVADAMAIMSSIEGLSGFLYGYCPTELAQQEARPAGEHGVSSNPQALAEERSGRCEMGRNSE